MIEKIWDFFEKSFGINAVIVMMIAMSIFYIVTNLPKIMDSITYFQSRKIKHITEALSSEWVDDNYKKILKKDISRLYLSGTLKIKANEKEVKEIIRLSDMTGDSFSTIEIYHAIKKLPSGFYNLPLDDLKSEMHILSNHKEIIIKLIFALIFLLFIIFFFLMNEFLKELKSIYIFDRQLILLFIFPIFMFIILIRDIFTTIKEIDSSNKVLKYFINKLESN